jgi:hypothetical protein
VTSCATWRSGRRHGQASGRKDAGLGGDGGVGGAKVASSTNLANTLPSHTNRQ